MFRSTVEKDRNVASISRIDEISPEDTMSGNTQKQEVIFRDSRHSPNVRQHRQDRDRVDSGYEASPSSTTGYFVFNFDNVGSTKDQQQRNSSPSGQRECSNLPELRLTPPTGYSFSTNRRGDEHFRFAHVSRFQRSSDDDASHIDSDRDAFIEKYESSSNSRRIYSESPPIPIPSVARGSPELESEGFRESSSSRLGMASVPIASTAPQQSSSSPIRLSSMLNPLSWPTFRTFISSSPIRLPSAFGTPPDSSGHDRSSRFTRLEDSFGLDEQAEDVFDTEDPVTDEVPEIEVPNFEACIAAEDYYHTQLSPETSLISPSPPFMSSRSSGNVRRNRSVSVNLPVERDLEQVCQDIGQTLRRLSDQFSYQLTMKRTSPRGRSHTVSGCSRSSSLDKDKSKDRSGAVPDEGCSRGTSTSAKKDHQIESQRESQRKST